MLKNYFKIAFRNIIRNKTLSFINIFGLAAGMAGAMLIFLWVFDELSYDDFHNNSENIYLILRGDKEGMTAVTSKMLAPALAEELPEVKKSTYFLQVPEAYKFLIRSGSNVFEENVIAAAPNFFDLFSFKFKYGNPAAALADPNSIVITEETAKKYFGGRDAIGKELNISAIGVKSLMKVSAVIETMPSTSHIQSGIILPASWFVSIGMNNFETWDQQSFHTYIELHDNSYLNPLPSKIKACETKAFTNASLQDITYSLLPLTKVHLYGSGVKYLEAPGDIKYVNIFIAIAVIILLIASINYMNLTTAFSFKRGNEVGIKKALGADRKTLALQFFMESLFLTFIALGLAIIIVELFLPEFNRLSGKELAINYSDRNFIGMLLSVAFGTGIISGSYPAMLLSSFNPLQIFKGKEKTNSWGLITRKGLVVFQFALSVIIIISTIVVFKQLSFIRQSKLGFDKENIVCIRLGSEANSRFGSLKSELLKNSAIKSVSRSEQLNSVLSRTGGLRWPGKSDEDNKSICYLNSDFDLVSVYKIEMSAGRFYSDDFPSDSIKALVINESAAKAMGMKYPLGREVTLWGEKRQIIGVTKDFHYASFHSAIEPLMIVWPDLNTRNIVFNTVSIKFAAKEPAGILSVIEKTWKEQLPGIPFDYYFFDESLNAGYKAEQRMSSIFKYFSFLSILISGLGLFGLASFSTAQRTKEIGVRKVLGASVTSITALLSKEFLLLVILSDLIAFPIAWFLMNNWLQDFVYRINLNWQIFTLSGGIAFLIAVITVSLQTIKAAKANPINSLKYE